MGFVKDVVGGIFGSGADAAKDAANAQAAATSQASAQQKEAADKSLEFQKEALAQSREDLQPFREAGQSVLPDLQSGISDLRNLVTNPAAQLDFIQNNPFFNALSEQATSTLLSNQAAKGKVGSGGTAEALQNSVLLLGSDLLNQNITQRQNVNNQTQNIAVLGQNAAAGQATATQATAANQSDISQNLGNNLADLSLQGGNAQAAGIIGSRNAQTGALNTTLKAGALFLCDMRAKEDIKRIGQLDNGLPVYKFRYKGHKDTNINVMAQDVEKIKPEAVIEHNGLKYVNMEAVCH